MTAFPVNFFVPGPPPTGKYEFLYVPGLGNTQFPPQGVLQLPTQNGWDWANYGGQQIERAIQQLGVFADRKDLQDRSRVYRVELRFLDQFRYDRLGSFVGQKPNLYRFTVDDPTLNKAILRDWFPVE